MNNELQDLQKRVAELEQKLSQGGNAALLIGQQNILPGAIKTRALAPTTTIAKGDLYYGDGNGNFARLAPGTAGQFLQTQGSAIPVWQGLGSWAAYNCQPSGWAATPTQTISQYYTIGNLCFVNINVTGTSNATNADFTAPVTCVNADSGCAASFAKDNSTTLTTPAEVFVRAGGTMINTYKDMAGTAWTNSGTKQVQFTVVYRI